MSTAGMNAGAGAGEAVDTRPKAGGTGTGGGADSKAVARRLQKELMQLMMSNDKAATAFPEGDNLFEWVGTLQGSEDTVYEGLTFKLKLVFPADYPYRPPTITFTTPCFHPNVDQYGNICLDILKDKWSAAYSVSTILVSLRSLLGEPNPASPLNGYAAQLWDNQEEYRKALLAKYAEGTVEKKDDKK